MAAKNPFTGHAAPKKKTTAFAAKPDPRILTERQIRQLLQLCHPDRHDGSALSQQVFDWLRKYPARAE